MLERLPTWDNEMCIAKNPVLQAAHMKISYNLLNVMLKNAAIELDGHIVTTAQNSKYSKIFTFFITFSP